MPSSPAQEEVVVVAEAIGANELRLVGGGPELGNWNPAQAPLGTRVDESHFRFALKLPVYSTSAFKLVRMRDGKQEWESRSNRYLSLQAGQKAPLKIRFQES
jgi:hypothetical protein